jgi:hypothetical protein
MSTALYFERAPFVTLWLSTTKTGLGPSLPTAVSGLSWPKRSCDRQKKKEIKKIFSFGFRLKYAVLHTHEPPSRMH